MESVIDRFMNEALAHGVESLELEFRKKITKHEFDAISVNLSKIPTVSNIGYIVTREELGTSGSRDITYPENPDWEGYTLYKEKLYTMDMDGIRISIASETQGDPDGTQKKIFRIKSRQSYSIENVWRIDMTRVETNDPRFLDDDEYAYELEVELMTNDGDAVYRYTIDHLVGWGFQLIQFLLTLTNA